MPATRSSGPPTAASLQPILMEALENFKQKHSKQNQDLIHKNRFLLKSTAELERVIKELKNENLELRIQVQKANSHAQYWRQRAESASSSSAHPANSEQTHQIRMALIEIANRCKTLESSLAHPQPSVSNSSSSSSSLTTYPDQVPALNPSIVASSSDSFAPLLPGRSRAELIALRERRRSQFSSEQEESRLSFINECSGTEDRSETTIPLEAWQSGSTDSLPPNSSSTDPPNQTSAGPSNHIPKTLQHQFVVSRPNRRQELMAPVPKSSSSRLGSTDSSNEPPPTNGLKTSTEHAELEIKEEGSEDQDSSEAENQSLPEDQTSASFSLQNRAMSQLNESSTSDSSSDSDQDDPPEDAPDVAEPGESKQKNARPKEQEALIDTQRRSRQSQRRSRKQRRTSLTPLHILENVSPADFSLPPLTLGSPESTANNTHESSRSGRTDESEDTKSSGIEISNLAAQSASAKRRDSGLTKEESEETADEAAQLSLDEGWEKRPLAKKKRVRAELDAVSEEHPASAPHHAAGLTVQEAAVNNLSGAGSREARRARKEVNYALPSLNKKMRRPDSDGSSTVKRKSSIKHSSHHHNLQTNTATTTNKPKSTSSNKSSGATPSTVPSNTSCSTSTTLTLHSSPLSSPPASSSSSNSFSHHLLANSHPSDHPPPPPKPSALNRLIKNPTPVLLNNNRATHASDHNKDILLNRGRRRTNNL
ncbi:hypothetical protein PGTUg99_029921 [Puccinia graminis f. sp. tritici]|uniref:Shugoshin C-terminal domain-containing protein n=1 Tax=Puccinia graminis f. sp. tritici TaxID=56615 RepID=A0A5B0PPU7_PUCGR|nr:hypothetical protein PGTUg99_029921 [Puccinia graminis f. sp. tritici]